MNDSESYRNIYSFSLKGKAQFVQKVTLEPLMDFQQKHWGWKYYKTKYTTFKFFFT